MALMSLSSYNCAFCIEIYPCPGRKDGQIEDRSTSFIIIIFFESIYKAFQAYRKDLAQDHCVVC